MSMHSMYVYAYNVCVLMECMCIHVSGLFVLVGHVNVTWNYCRSPKKPTDCTYVRNFFRRKNCGSAKKPTDCIYVLNLFRTENCGSAEKRTDCIYVRT